MKALFFTYVWPEPESSAAGVRTRELMESLLERGWEVHAWSPSKENAFSEALTRLGVHCRVQAPNDASADPELARLAPHAVIFDRFVMEEQFGWRVREACPRAALVVDTQDLHFVRRARERGEPFESGTDFVRELSSLYRADLALVVSAWERDLLLRYGFPETQLEWLPLFARVESEIVPRSRREGLAFLGNFRHPPNLDGVKWLARELWPLVKEFGVPLHLYGAYPPESVSALAQEGIHVHGPVNDHRAALSRHVASLAPLRFGAGIKGKVLESWCTGTPVVGTPVAFEGMGKSVGLEFVDAETFTSAVKRVTGDQEEWQRLSQEGLAHARECFGGHEAHWAERLTRLVAEREDVREKNLVGRLLRHSQANATKYFSRWIEEKEKTRLKP